MKELYIFTLTIFKLDQMYCVINSNYEILLKGSSLEDDDDWEKFQTGIGKRDRVLEGKSKLSHTVHCPQFPDVSNQIYSIIPLLLFLRNLSYQILFKK